MAYSETDQMETSYKTDALIAEDIEAYLEKHQHKSMLRFITCGSVDDGKSTLIGRILYDTGMVFEASRKGVLIGGGGRYDGLCSLLGAPATVPAVGFSIAIDRLEDAA